MRFSKEEFDALIRRIMESGKDRQAEQDGPEGRIEVWEGGRPSTFVNEKISEADFEKFYSYTLWNPINRTPLNPYIWTIDRGRDVVLICKGGQGLEHSDIPMYWALIWKGQKITLETFSGGRGDYFDGAEKWWRITSIEIPYNLRNEKDSVIQLIKEVFYGYGSGGRREHIKKVEFRFIAELQYY